MRRYVMALVIAVGLILAGGLFALATSAYRTSLKIPPGGAIELPSLTIWCVFLAYLLTGFWWVLVPLVFVVCLGAAWLLGSSAPAQEK